MPRTLHPSTFEYLKPTDGQLATMAEVRSRFREFVEYLDDTLPPGADKTYLLRHIREAAMWANVTITRGGDGTPRDG